ncbi:MAG: uracil-DNA glycosylase, partial [Nitrososphaera sp.]|nr:uracil-DNA glycosylase [Nitrososphaera sp.]
YGNVIDVIEEARRSPKSAVMSRIPEYAEQIKLAYELSYILSSVDQLDEDQQVVFLSQWNAGPTINWDEVQRFIDAYELKKVGAELRSVLIDNSLEGKLMAADSLEKMFEIWGDCTRCKLHKVRNKIVKYSGPAKARIMALGEGPGPSEDFYGDPFVGKAGRYLNETLLAYAGLERVHIHVANIVLCFPNENGEIRPPDTEEVAACNPRLRAHIHLVSPKLVILLGDKAFKAIFPDSEKISSARGVPLQSADWPGITFLPVFHPSYLMRLQQGPNGHSDVIKSLNDWKLIKNLAETL